WREVPITKLPAEHNSSHVSVTFAADKHSLYFEGKRTDNNGGGNRLDIKTLHQVEFRPPRDPDLLGLILRDANFLYINGHRLADPDSFRVLAQKSWDQR
ncbi:DKNYY family protein, partial [Escherichia sp. R-CC3]